MTDYQVSGEEKPVTRVLRAGRGGAGRGGAGRGGQLHSAPGAPHPTPPSAGATVPVIPYFIYQTIRKRLSNFHYLQKVSHHFQSSVIFPHFGTEINCVVTLLTANKNNSQFRRFRLLFLFVTEPSGRERARLRNLPFAG